MINFITCIYISGLNCEDHGCNEGTLAQGWGSGTANYPYLVTVSLNITCLFLLTHLFPFSL